MKQRRCMNPQHPNSEDRWHEARRPCPACGDEPVFNKALAAVALNDHLYGQVERQHNEAQFAKKARTEKAPF